MGQAEWKTFAGRFNWAFKAKNERLIRAGHRPLSYRALADLTDVSNGVFTQWSDGTANRPAARNVAAVAAQLDVDPDWLARNVGSPQPLGKRLQELNRMRHGAGEPEIPYEANLERPAALKHQVPLISWVQAGAWTEAVDPFAPGAGYRFEDVSVPVGPNAFALEVRGDSMEPLFPDGCTLIVDPSRVPKSGDFVIARANDRDEATFKKYVKDGPIHRLIPLNPQYRDTLVSTDAVICGVVVEKIVRERF